MNRRTALLRNRAPGAVLLARDRLSRTHVFEFKIRLADDLQLSLVTRGRRRRTDELHVLLQFVRWAPALDAYSFQTFTISVFMYFSTLLEH